MKSRLHKRILLGNEHIVSTDNLPSPHQNRAWLQIRESYVYGGTLYSIKPINYELLKPKEKPNFEE